MSKPSARTRRPEALAVGHRGRAPDAFWSFGVSIEGADLRQLSLFRSRFVVGDAQVLPSREQTPSNALGTIVLWRVRRGVSPDPRHLEDFRTEWISRRRAPESPKPARANGGAEPGEPTSPANRLRQQTAGRVASHPIALAFVHHATPGDDELLYDTDALLVYRDNEDLDRELETFAWRLERHWLVEWSDQRPRSTVRSSAKRNGKVETQPTREREGPFRRPPVMMVDYRGVSIIGADLPPQLQPAVAALTAFELVTADELGATFRYLQLPVPAAPELSRTLRYLEEAGFLVLAPTELAEQYRRERGGLGRRPLRVYISAAFSLARDLGTILGRRALDPVRVDQPSFDGDGRPAAAARAELTRWADMRESSDLRTV